MRKIIVEKNGKKVINYIKSQFPNVSENILYKALRQKDIRINSVKITENLPVKTGDEITLYVKDDLLLGSHFTLQKGQIIYEDDNILIVDKPQNILVQGNATEIGLEQMVNAYCHTSSLRACHRLDRNTAGLVIFAKDKESEDIIVTLIRQHEITKQYQCLVYGQPHPKKATLKHFLFKDAKQKRVIIASEKKPGYVEIITKYEVLSSYPDGSSLLAVELVTGRTHQIRAHLAYIGCPIIGDGKYGNNQINKKFKKTWQELASCQITFQNAYGKLSYLKGKTFHRS